MRIFCVLAFLIFSSTVRSAGFQGRVVAVIDGDTVLILTSRRVKVKVRLSEIDAPEKKQAFGKQAKAALSGMIFGRSVHVATNGHDKYGRVIGRIYLGRVDVNLKMVEMGFAWHYKKYSKNTEYAEAEAKARRERKGLWGGTAPVPPWIFRKRRVLQFKRW